MAIIEVALHNKMPFGFACLKFLILPDALILAAARNANCFVLLAYNTRHFAKVSGIKVFTPRDFVALIRAALWKSFKPKG